MQRVLFLLLPGFATVDVAGAIAIFDSANAVLAQLGKPQPYGVRLLAARPRAVVGSSGIPLGTCPLPTRMQGAIAKLIIAGDSRAFIDEFDAPERRILPGWLRRHARQVEVGATIGQAARVLAQMASGGLSQGVGDPMDRRSVDWIEVSHTCGIHLAMDLITRDHGSAIASVIASRLAAPFREAYRSSASRAAPDSSRHEQPRVAELHRWIAANLRKSFSVASLAEHLAMSERTFARFYGRETGSTPAAGVERIRVEAAMRLLREDRRAIKAIALLCGFSSSEVMRRAFIRNLKISPQQYRSLIAGGEGGDG